MKSILLDDFIDLFRRLPSSVRSQARRNYQLWKQNPHHPSLHFKRAHTKEPVYFGPISSGYRALGLLEEGTISWFWIGTHNDYEKFLPQL